MHQWMRKQRQTDTSEDHSKKTVTKVDKSWILRLRALKNRSQCAQEQAGESRYHILEKRLQKSLNDQSQQFEQELAHRCSPTLLTQPNLRIFLSGMANSAKIGSAVSAAPCPDTRFDRYGRKYVRRRQ